VPAGDVVAPDAVVAVLAEDLVAALLAFLALLPFHKTFRTSSPRMMHASSWLSARYTIHISVADIQTTRHTVQTYRHIGIQANRHTDKERYRHTDKQTYQHTDIQAYRHTVIQICRHTGMQTYRHTGLLSDSPLSVPGTKNFILSFQSLGAQTNKWQHQHATTIPVNAARAHTGHT
jgi:hypothetical protein